MNVKMAEGTYGNVPLFRDLTGDQIENQETTEVESWCPNCEENGTTRLLLTKIPFFKEVILISFECSHCGLKNNEIQSGSRIQEKGCKFTVQINNEKDMNRQVVKTESATFRIPSLDFEIPANTQKGELTTVEGLISRAIEGLEQEQPIRKSLYPDVAEKIDNFIQKLKNLAFPFTLELDDPAGNSFVENPLAPQSDPAMKVDFYERSLAHDKMLGLQPDDATETQEAQSNSTPGNNQTKAVAVTAPNCPVSDVNADDNTEDVAPEEVMSFADNCSNCNSPVETRMKLCNIPFFKEVVIMAVNCGVCGFKSSEVKSGGGMEDKGKKIVLQMTDVSDLNRDVLQAETCVVRIPELEFECPRGLNTGKFTTLEGLLSDIKSDLGGKYPFVFGDSAVDDRKQKMKEFIDKVDKIISGELMVKLELDDPAGNSYLQNVYAPDPDPEMTIEIYERTEEQNDELGITHMKTENYIEEG